jgi:serine/threonine-protein kinase
MSDGEKTRRERPTDHTGELTTPRESMFGAEPAPSLYDEATETADPDTKNEKPPTRFPVEGWDRYKFVSFLGRGGMGAVYKARDPQLSRFVALKFLLRTEAERAKRFVAEARSQARVEHEHVCKVYEVGDACGVPYIAMQFIDGVTLSRAQEQMTLDDKVHVMRKVADAVHAAHQGGLIHRDLKRSNVMVEKTAAGKWQPFVLDFGIARELDAGATIAGEVAGTPAYMAPEQAKGERADRRTDVWGLGATMYALLAGRPPNQGTTAEAFAALVTKDVPPIKTVAPQLPGDLATIVMKCLERDPQRRYPSAAAVSDDLRRYLAREPIAARPDSLVYRASKRLRRSWALAGALVALACAVVAVGVMWWRSAQRERLAEERVRIAQKFGQEVTRVETMMRQAYAAPLHDTRKEKQQVLARMAAIASEAKQLGDVATGPSEYAIGRGHLSLHDYGKARTHLEAALKAGYDTPEARYALGLALAALYRDGVNEADRIHDKTQRAARKEDLKKTLRDPALAYLRAVGEAAPEASTYAEGLVALYENDYATALARAATATQAAPWLYEAHQLAGDALTARASDGRDKGNYDESTTDLEAAAKEYATALTAAPSDATLLDAECRRRQGAMWVGIHTRHFERADLDAVLEPCERAIKADPESMTVLLRESFILADSADYLVEHRGVDPSDLLARAQPLLASALAIDPKSARAEYARSLLLTAVARTKCDKREPCEPDVDKALDLLHHVIDLDPGDEDAYSDITFLLQERADRVRERGDDPRKILDQAIDTATRGIAVAPKAETLKADLGSVWQARADYESEKGMDPQESLAKAIAGFQSALEQNPKDASALTNLGLTMQTRAYFRLHHGDPEGEADLDRATQTYERVLALGGTDSKVLNNLGYVDVDRADHLAQTGRDPKPAVDDGVAYMQKALAANPNERYVYFNTAGMQLTQAEYQVEHGQGPAVAIDAVHVAVAADLARSKEPDPDIIAYDSGAHLLAARWAMANKHSPTAELAAAEHALARAEQLDARSAFVMSARIDLERWRAEWLVSQGGDPTAPLARARVTVAKISETDHGSPAVHLWLGELAAIEARSLKPTDPRRASVLDTAKKELAAAVAGDKFYEQRAAALLGN